MTKNGKQSIFKLNDRVRFIADLAESNCIPVGSVGRVSGFFDPTNGETGVYVLFDDFDYYDNRGESTWQSELEQESK